MILERIRQLKRVLREVCHFKTILNKYGNHLLPGRYVLYPSLRAFAAENPATKAQADRYFAKNVEPSKTQTLISKINGTSYFCNKKGGAALYEAVYSANNYDKMREVKLFSFDRKEILTICTGPDAMQTQLAEYESLHSFFPMPRVEQRDLYPNAYAIAMVDLVTRPEEGLALEAICNCVSRYHASHKAETALSPRDILTFPYEAPFHALLEDLSRAIDPAALEQPIPLCFQHGDLSRDNLIYGTCRDTTDFWWIDWEHARPRLFFYDYFFYILNTAVYFQDTAALDAYLGGEYDAHLDRFFSQFGLSYDRHLRKSYFLLFAIAFLKERVCDKDNLQALQMYHTYICDQVINKK